MTAGLAAPPSPGPGARAAVLRVAPWPDPQWAATSQGAALPTVTARWLGLAPKRLPGELTTFTLVAQGAPVIGVTGVVMAGPSPNNRLDPYEILSGGSVHQGLATGGPHPWQGRERAALYPCLLLMSPHYECLPVGPGAASERWCAELVARLVEWAGDQGLRSIAFEYLTPEAEPLLKALRANGFAVVELAARCDLRVDWGDFAGYLDTLPSKRRIEARRELRALRESGVRVLERRLRAHEPDLVRLRCQLVAKYANTPDPAKEAAYFERMRASFAPEEISVFEAVRGERVLGFGLFIQDGDVWMPIATGSDYTDPASRLTYFATLFYRPAELAPQRGVRLIPYGLGSWAAKRARGCRLSPLYAAALRRGRSWTG